MKINQCRKLWEEDKVRRSNDTLGTETTHWKETKPEGPSGHDLLTKTMWWATAVDYNCLRITVNCMQDNQWSSIERTGCVYKPTCTILVIIIAFTGNRPLYLAVVPNP